MRYYIISYIERRKEIDMEYTIPSWIEVILIHNEEMETECSE